MELGLEEIEFEGKRQSQLRNHLWYRLSQLNGIHLNGHPTQRLPGNLNISVEKVDGSALLLGLQSTVAVSSGSACSSIGTTPSHVLLALGYENSLVYASLRFGLGRFTTTQDINQVSESTINTIKSLRQVTI